MYSPKAVYSTISVIRGQEYRIDILQSYDNGFCYDLHKIKPQYGHRICDIHGADRIPCMTRAEEARYPKTAAKTAHELLRFFEAQQAA